jgi:hypothetical protein
MVDCGRACTPGGIVKGSQTRHIAFGVPMPGLAMVLLAWEQAKNRLWDVGRSDPQTLQCPSCRNGLLFSAATE